MSDVLDPTKETRSCSELLHEHSSLVKRIAFNLHRTLPASIAIEDLIQLGMIGLNEAIKTYDPSKGAVFTTYASLKIRGAMLDDLRSQDWVPRSVYENSRKISKAMQAVENREGKEGTAQQIADELGIDISTYHRMISDISTGKMVDLFDPNFETENTVLDKNKNSPHHSVQDSQANERLALLIEGLPEKEQQMLSMYYFEDLNFKEIGLIFGVSESRVSQIHSQALARLKGRLDND